LEKYLSLPIQNKNKAKILHITDTHLFSDDNDSLLGIKTNASFNAVIDEIKQHPCDFDLIVATGDFVQDGSKNGYLRFANLINQFSMPCVWLLGNHDIYTNMKEVFEQQNLPERKVVLLGDNWLIILLNSQVQGKAFGMLSPSELSFLSLNIEHYPDRFVMVFLHHHPVMSNCRWLDQHCLKNKEELGLLVKQYQRIKSIAWGHIHQNIESGVELYQFKNNLLHTKSVLIDNQLSLVGTVNLDMRSLWLNFELTAVIDDTEFAKNLNTLLQDYLKNSDLIIFSTWQKRPFWQHIIERLFYFFAPLL